MRAKPNNLKDRNEQDEDSSQSNRSKCDATSRTSIKMQDACADMETDPVQATHRCMGGIVREIVGIVREVPEQIMHLQNDLHRRCRQARGGTSGLYATAGVRQC